VFGYHVNRSGGLGRYVEWAATVYFPPVANVP
jgi:hypothetical protein